MSEREPRSESGSDHPSTIEDQPSSARPNPGPGPTPGKAEGEESSIEQALENERDERD